MSNPYLGEIRLAGFNFAPQGWSFCNGSVLQIAEFDALFALLGTTYGGDGQTTFALPDLRGRVPIHMSGNFPIGARSGQESVQLTGQQVPSHNHSSTLCSSGAGTSGAPSNGATWAVSQKGSLYAGAAPSVTMGPQAIANAGGGQPHENRQPSLAINYIISLFGIFPSQN
jgi:microcystin-dependent protein